MSKKIVVFGTGLFYIRRKDDFPKNSEIVAFIDNDSKMQGRYFDGVMVYNPKEISRICYDIIVLASTFPIEMKSQLLSMGISEAKIMFWEQYVSGESHGILVKYNVLEGMVGDGQKDVLIIVPTINYAGGFLAALYAGLALKKKGGVSYCNSGTDSQHANNFRSQ